MHATIDVRFTISIDEAKTIPLATVAEFFTEQNVESALVEELVESLDAGHVEALCGEKHATGNGDRRFRRAGTDTRTAVTPAGGYEFTLHYVEDTAAPKNTATSSSSSFPTVSPTQTLTLLFLTEQSVTAKTTTARTTPSKPRSAKTPPRNHALCWNSR